MPFGVKNSDITRWIKEINITLTNLSVMINSNAFLLDIRNIILKFVLKPEENPIIFEKKFWTFDDQILGIMCTN